MLLFAAAIFLGAFLLFQVQPILGRFLLPWFGGVPAVWTTCLLFFQSLLLLGYAYSHSLRAWSVRRQVAVHTALLLLSLLFLPILPDPAWKPLGSEAPIGKILLLLLVTVGLPYLLLASASPLLQAWFHRVAPGRNPYPLYALSNLGSLLALGSYPFLVEPYLRLGTQARLWSWGYGIFVGLTLLCAGGVRRTEHGSEERDRIGMGSVEAIESDPDASLAWIPLLRIVLLAACGSSLLLATTNQLCQDVMVVPFLWVLPLGIYLLTFILCFQQREWYSRRLVGPFFLIGAVGSGLVSYYGIDASFYLQIAVYGIALLAVCLFCHGEIAQQKPHPKRLTAYYLAIAGGGALGGVFVALLAPVLFLGIWEYPFTLALSFLLGLWVVKSDPRSRFFRRESWWVRRGAIAGFFILLAIGERTVRRDLDGDIATVRNFYGVLRVKHAADRKGEPCIVMKHGRILHGLQYAEAERRMWKTTYYSPESGCGIAFARHPLRRAGKALRVGIIGLGAGGIAPHAEAGDLFRFYEINPAVVRLCQEHFTYLRDCHGKVEIILGDARLMLEKESGEDAPYDLLIVDAFSGDAIPAHLLTLECFGIYRRRLAEGGILAIHISNRFLDLKPVVFGAAKELGMQAGWFFLEDYGEKGAFPGSWILMGDGAFWRDPEVVKAQTPWSGTPILWTDDFLSLWSVLRW